MTDTIRGSFVACDDGDAGLEHRAETDRMADPNYYPAAEGGTPFARWFVDYQTRAGLDASQSTSAYYTGVSAWRAALAASPAPETPQTTDEAVFGPIAWGNRDELDNMLDDRAAIVEGKESGWRRTALYDAATVEKIVQASIGAGELVDAPRTMAAQPASPDARSTSDAAVVLPELPRFDLLVETDRGPQSPPGNWCAWNALSMHEYARKAIAADRATRSTEAVAQPASPAPQVVRDEGQEVSERERALEAAVVELIAAENDFLDGQGLRWHVAWSTLLALAPRAAARDGEAGAK